MIMNNNKASKIRKVILFPFKAIASAGLLIVGGAAEQISKATTGESGYLYKVCTDAVGGIWGTKSKEQVVDNHLSAYR